MSDEGNEELHDHQLTGDDPMMKRAEMMATGGDARSLGEPEPPGNPVPPPETERAAEGGVEGDVEGDAVARARPGEVVPASDFEPDASQ